MAADNTIDFSQWRLLYNQILSGAYVAPISLPNITQLNTDYFAASDNAVDNVVSLALINYASIKPTAITDGYMYLANGQLHDGGNEAKLETGVNRPIYGPYQTNRLFIAAAANNTAKNGVLNLAFKPTLYYSNTGLTISSIEVDFDNGNGFVSASFNTTLSATYSSIGNKQLIYKITFSNGSIAQCYNTVYVPYIPSASTASRYASAPTIGGADIPDVILESPNNAHSGIDLFIRRSITNTAGSNTNPQFKKPLIIVEGLDLSSATALLGNGYNYNSFRDEIRNPNLTSFVVGTNPLQPFDQYLDDVAGYDLIFVNWHNGVDDILRNALALRDVINYVNAHKQSVAEQNVIMGISMGGLVSRYCLAQMVKSGGTGINDHQTRLLITHDSPHRGANIPLALQHLLQGLRKQRIKGFLGNDTRLDDIIPQMKDINTAINSPAATQQLLARVVDEYGTLSFNTFLDGDYRTMVNFDGTGFTQPYRFVATSNGSQCGEKLSDPYSSLVSLDAEGKANLFGLFLWTKGKTFLDMRRLPGSNLTSKILDFNLKLKIKFLGINLLKIAMDIQQNAPSNLIALDGLAGGTRNLGGAVESSTLSNIDPASGGANWIIFGFSYNYSTPYVAPSFCFVPTTSALDIANFNAVNMPYSVPQTGLNGSRASNYIAQENITLPPPTGTTSNVTHTDFYARTCRWLFNEMENITNTINCDDYCASSSILQNITINGPRIVCNGATYSLSNLPAGYTATWSLPPGSGSTLVLATNGPNNQGTQCTVTNMNYYQLNVNLIVTLKINGCVVGTITKLISTDNDYQNPSTRGYSYVQDACLFYNVQHPQETGIVYPSIPAYIHQGCNVTVNLGSLVAEGKTVTYYAGNQPTYWSFNGQILYFAMPYGSGGVPVTFKISGDGACYDRNISFYVITANGRSIFTATPNPVNDLLTINVTEQENISQNNKKNTPKEYLIKIAEFNTSLPIKQFRVTKNGPDFKVNMAGLKTGYYAIEINDGTDKQVLKVFKL